MQSDPTESIRRTRQAELNSGAKPRDLLTITSGAMKPRISQRSRTSSVDHTCPYWASKDRTTGKKGSLEFQHSPRFYFKFVAD
jgi:hypothetical protein